MAIPQSKISMNLVLFNILKLLSSVLSRPVVCANFKGQEANTFFPASGVCQGHSTYRPLIIAVALARPRGKYRTRVLSVRFRDSGSITPKVFDFHDAKVRICGIICSGSQIWSQICTHFTILVPMFPEVLPLLLSHVLILENTTQLTFLNCIGDFSNTTGINV